VITGAARVGVVLATVLAPAALGACAGRPAAVGIGARAAVPPTRDQLLDATSEAVWHGDLPAADAALAQLSDRELGAADNALDFWSELVALLRCEPLRRTPSPAAGPGDAWEQLRRLVQIERVRWLRQAQPAALAGTKPLRATPSRAPGEVIWPSEAERWSDELPRHIFVDRCPAVPEGETEAAAPSARERALVSATAETLPLDHPAAPLLLLHAAVLELAGRDGGAASEALARLEAVSRAGMGGEGRPLPSLPPEEKTQLALVSALAAIEDSRTAPEALLARARAALSAALPLETRRALAFEAAERLRAAGRADDAASVLGPPPHGEDVLGRYVAFRQVEAHAAAGRRAELLAEARVALKDHPRAVVDADPALAATLDLALRTLLASPVTDDTMELLEALGPPRERLARAEAFGQLALASAAHESAMATFMWLYHSDGDPARQLQHLARASVAAARAGSARQFALTFRLLAGEEEPTEPATSTEAAGSPPASKDGGAGKDKGKGKGKGKGMIASAEAELVREKRSAARSANWQRALLVVARDALPALVDGHDQVNLATLVATLKHHLDDGGRGPADEELTTLYRAASAHLKEGPRAYAETVGAERRPILLGDVMIGRHYDVPLPEVEVAPEDVGALVFVPGQGTDADPAALRRWARPIGVELTGSGS
jgi:hypothetical protein